MKVLVIGGSGYIGQKLINQLKLANVHAVSASRKTASNSDEIQLDTTDKQAMTAAIAGFDVIINCVAGNFNSIAMGAKVLVEAAIGQKNKPRIVHLSSMAVYGKFEGAANEQTPLDPALGWYAKAKCEAEALISNYVAYDGEAIILRPGCVYDAQSYLWVGRISSWLKHGRLGDIGELGDGWSNLVHVDDVIRAILAALSIDLSSRKLAIFNLAAPDSPRWNVYFKDLALITKAVPLKRVRATQLWLDTRLASPPLKVAELLFKRIFKGKRLMTFPFPAPLLRFFSQQIKLDATLAGELLISDWISYSQGKAEISLLYDSENTKL